VIRRLPPLQVLVAGDLLGVGDLDLHADVHGLPHGLLLLLVSENEGSFCHPESHFPPLLSMVWPSLFVTKATPRASTRGRGLLCPLFSMFSPFFRVV